MTPRDQAIEEAAVELCSHHPAERCKVACDHCLGTAMVYTRVYESARARLDGAKMMPREITYEQRVAAVNTTDPGIGEPPLYEKLFHAMHDATPKEGT